MGRRYDTPSLCRRFRHDPCPNGGIARSTPSIGAERRWGVGGGTFAPSRQRWCSLSAKARNPWMACFPQETLVLSNVIAVPLLLRNPPSDWGAPKVKSGDTGNATRLTFS